MEERVLMLTPEECQQMALAEIDLLRKQRDHARRVAEALAYPAWDNDQSSIGPDATDPTDGWHPLPEMKP